MTSKDPTFEDEFDFELLPDDVGDVFEQLDITSHNPEDGDILYDDLYQGELQF